MILLKILIGVILFVYVFGSLLACIGMAIRVNRKLKEDPEDEIDTIEIIIEKVNKDDNKEDS